MIYIRSRKETEVDKIMNIGVNYTIISKPSYITFECPFCHENVEVNFSKVDFKTSY